MANHALSKCLFREAKQHLENPYKHGKNVLAQTLLGSSQLQGQVGYSRSEGDSSVAMLSCPEPSESHPLAHHKDELANCYHVRLNRDLKFKYFHVFPCEFFHDRRVFKIGTYLTVFSLIHEAK